MKDIQIHNNLNAFSQHILASKGKLILISGDAGMGKTALMFSVILQSPQNMHFIQAFGQDKESITFNYLLVCIITQLYYLAEPQRRSLKITS